MFSLNSFYPKTLKYKHGLSPALEALANALGTPIVRGTMFYVDPLNGKDSTSGYNGLDLQHAFTSINAAYAACTTNKGDGIMVFGADADTAANTTSFLSAPLVWAKNSISVFGVTSPTKTFQRAKITNVTHTITASTIAFPTATTITDSASGFLTALFAVGDVIRINTTQNTNDSTGNIITAVTAGTITCAASTFTIQTAGTAGATTINSYCTDLVSVTGSNNYFSNLSIIHLGTDPLELTALKVGGNRNTFVNVHAGVGVADANTTITHSLWLYACQENTFYGCTFGLDSVDRGGVATYDILLSGAVARNKFYDCETIRQSSTGTGCLAVYADTTTGGRPTLFKGCIFSIWNTAGGNANCSYMGASTGTCDFIWLVDCTYPGFAAMSNDSVFWISGEINSQASGLMYT
jgi:uncharacterized membrane protein